MINIPILISALIATLMMFATLYIINSIGRWLHNREHEMNLIRRSEIITEGLKENRRIARKWIRGEVIELINKHIKDGEGYKAYCFYLDFNIDKYIGDNRPLRMCRKYLYLHLTPKERKQLTIRTIIE